MKITKYMDEGFQSASWQLDMVKLVCKENNPPHRILNGTMAEWFRKIHGFTLTNDCIKTALKFVETNCKEYIVRQIQNSKSFSFTIDEWSSCNQTFRTYSNINIYLQMEDSTKSFCLGNSKIYFLNVFYLLSFLKKFNLSALLKNCKNL